MKKKSEDYSSALFGRAATFSSVSVTEQKKKQIFDLLEEKNGRKNDTQRLENRRSPWLERKGKRGALLPNLHITAA